VWCLGVFFFKRLVRLTIRCPPYGIIVRFVRFCFCCTAPCFEPALPPFFYYPTKPRCPIPCLLLSTVPYPRSPTPTWHTLCTATQYFLHGNFPTAPTLRSRSHAAFQLLSDLHPLHFFFPTRICRRFRFRIWIESCLTFLVYTLAETGRTYLHFPNCQLSPSILPLLLGAIFLASSLFFF